MIVISRLLTAVNTQLQFRMPEFAATNRLANSDDCLPSNSGNILTAWIAIRRTRSRQRSLANYTAIAFLGRAHAALPNTSGCSCSRVTCPLVTASTFLHQSAGTPRLRQLLARCGEMSRASANSCRLPTIAIARSTWFMAAFKHAVSKQVKRYV